MASRDEEKDEARSSDPGASDEEASGGAIERASAEGETPAVSSSEEGETPATLGATRYVHAAFFVAGIIAAYLSGKLMLSLWNYLAEWPAVTRVVPQLLGYAEEDRGTITMVAGAVIGLIAVIRIYRKEATRRWADEVAGELARVTWPDKETVSNGTLVVVIASAVATVYIALLDRFWGFVTNLVYS